MLGHTDRVHDVLAASDLLVSPVRYEPYGLNVQEALCCGIPAMVSATAGVAERYTADLRDLLIPEPTDVDGLVARMLGWRSSDEQLEAARGAASTSITIAHLGSDVARDSRDRRRCAAGGRAGSVVGVKKESEGWRQR